MIGHTSKLCRVARDKYCNNCGLIGHFATVCRTKKTQERGPKNKQPWKTTHRVNTLTDQEDIEDEDYVWTVGNQHHYLMLPINGIKYKFIIDSGATVNLMDEKTFIQLGYERAQLDRLKTKIFPYGSKNPLKVIGILATNIELNSKIHKVKFHVVKGESGSLIGRKTAEDLEILKIELPSVNSITDTNYDIQTLLDKYKTVFQGLGKLKDFQLKLYIDESIKPIAQPVRTIPFSMRQQVASKIDELIQDDIIEPVKGPTSWVSPLVCVPKPKGDIRLCIDMRQANCAILRERFPIPTVEEVLQDLNGATTFSILDLRAGYHQLELDPNSRDITTFVSHKGLFRYKRLIFGVNCAAEMYQKTLQQVLQGLEGCRNISDDIVVFGKSVSEHNKHLELVLERLQANNLTLNKDKCKFLQSKLTFMGHTLSDKGVEPDIRKIEAIHNAKVPTNAKEVRSFLGLVTFCAKFINNFSTILEPLRTLTRKNQAWEWTQKHQSAFEQLRNSLSDPKILAYFHPSRLLKLTVDASPFGLGAILSQQQSDESYRPLAYASRVLTSVERNYSQTEREALSIYWAVQRFRIYLHGHDFVVVTDHKPLEVIFNSPKHKPPPRIEKWIMNLQTYKFTVNYSPGYSNAADMLSRSPVTTCENNKSEDYVNFIANHAVPKAISMQEIVSASDKDKLIQCVISNIRSGNWNKKDSNLRPYYLVKSDLSTNGQILLHHGRLVIPEVLRSQTLDLAHEGHQGIVKCKERVREKVWWPGIDRDLEKLISSCHACQLTGNSTRPPEVHMTELPTDSWKKVSADLMGPFPTGESLLVIVDYYSRFPVVEILQSTTSSVIIHRMHKIFSIHGLPETLVTDNGPQFISDDFARYLQQCGINHHRVTPLWPRADGEVERFNRVLKKAIQTSHSEGKNWKFEIYTFLLAYRTTAHSVTGIPPSELMFCRKIRSKLPEFNPVT